MSTQESSRSPTRRQEVMDPHPNQWGPVVGYAYSLLSKEYGRHRRSVIG
jgi:hypothetical protein